MIIGSFGKLLVFEVNADKILTPRGVKREMSAAYEEHKVLLHKPRLEFLAPELNSFSFSVLLSASMGVEPMPRASSHHTATKKPDASPKEAPAFFLRLGNPQNSGAYSMPNPIRGWLRSSLQRRKEKNNESMTKSFIKRGTWLKMPFFA